MRCHYLNSDTLNVDNLNVECKKSFKSYRRNLFKGESYDEQQNNY